MVQRDTRRAAGKALVNSSGTASPHPANCGMLRLDTGGEKVTPFKRACGDQRGKWLWTNVYPPSSWRAQPKTSDSATKRDRELAGLWAARGVAHAKALSARRKKHKIGCG